MAAAPPVARRRDAGVPTDIPMCALSPSASARSFSSICRESMAENSSEKPSMRTAILPASDDSLL